jgi:TPR repeat protein
MLVTGSSCRERPQERERKEGGLERGRRMQSEAAACEGGTGAACLAACDLGHSNSCARAGDAAADRAAALALYRRACDGGSGLGCAAAGLHDEARFYLRVHCDQAHAASCAELGRVFAEGRGGPRDPAAAATFRRRACALGHAASCGR